MDGGAWWAAVQGVAKSRAQLSDFTFTFHFHALAKKMATRSSVLVWRIPGTEEPDGLLSMGSHRFGHDWSDLAAAAAAAAADHTGLQKARERKSMGEITGGLPGHGRSLDFISGMRGRILMKKRPNQTPWAAWTIKRGWGSKSETLRSP